MSDAIPFIPGVDLSGLRITQSHTGHCHSPWFTFDCDSVPSGIGRTVNYAGERYQWVKHASVEAFARYLGISSSDVFVSERADTSSPHFERWWRLGTKNPCRLPAPKISAPKPAKLSDGPPAIDI